ncbi:MAG: Zn-dependent exopeptidase M28 [Candidatus Heimdallarchaeota archaeon]|nr:MAG: Zn-dependent exopeptidase M28 [Candidatus Heimdallarchaeota archaeon]
MNLKTRSLFQIFVIIALSGYMMDGGTINDIAFHRVSSDVLSGISPYGPPISDFHTFLPHFMTSNWTEDIEHYRSLVKFFSQQFPNRGWEWGEPPVQYENNSLAVTWFEETLRNYTRNEIEPLPGQPSLIFGEFHHIVGVIPSAIQSSTAILIGAHIDSVLGTPGADDNSSGAMAILEIARLLTEANWSINTNLVLCGFNREEIGPGYGSEELAEFLSINQPFDIRLVVNFDMLLNENVGEKNKIDVIFDGDQEYENGAYWAGLFKSTSHNYGADFIRTVSSYDDWRWGHSDHYGFVTRGFPSVFLIESNLTDIYHSSADMWDVSSYNYTQAYEAILSILAAIRFIEETASTFHGFHIQIDSSNHKKFLIIPEKNSVIAVRSWDFHPKEESLFVVKTIDGLSIADANWIPSGLSYWAGSVKNESLVIEINEIDSDAKLDVTVGQDSNNNLLPDIWENAFEPLGSGDSDDDNDGLTNFEEFSFNLHPHINDIDNDGWNDGTEIQGGTNPRDPNDYPAMTPSITTTTTTTPEVTTVEPTNTTTTKTTTTTTTTTTETPGFILFPMLIAVISLRWVYKRKKTRN